MTTSLTDARRRLCRGWEELDDLVADRTGVRLRRSGWGLLAVAFCLGLYLAGRERNRRR